MAGVVSTRAGTRIEPKDSLEFVRGTTATFKIIFTNNGIPTTVDSSTVPVAKILEPNFLSNADNPIPTIIITLTGTLVAGQDFEYEFEWEIPADQVPLDTYIVSYQATIGGLENTYGDEFFTVAGFAGVVGVKDNFYATVDDVRKYKFNIDSYLPKEFAKDLTQRNILIEEHLRNATTRLREELNLNKARGNSENYRLFTLYYTIWSIMFAARGEDGSSVSDSNLASYRREWQRILAQEKRESVMQGIPMGRG